jgi:hypothetical protein
MAARPTNSYELGRDDWAPGARLRRPVRMRLLDALHKLIKRMLSLFGRFLCFGDST